MYVLQKSDREGCKDALWRLRLLFWKMPTNPDALRHRTTKSDFV